MPDLKVGDRFDIDGYHECARAECDDGYIVLVHNESTHYLIALIEPDPVDGRVFGATLLASQRYDNHGDMLVRAIYLRMLFDMSNEAARRSTSLDEA